MATSCQSGKTPYFDTDMYQLISFPKMKNLKKVDLKLPCKQKQILLLPAYWNCESNLWPFQEFHTNN